MLHMNQLGRKRVRTPVVQTQHPAPVLCLDLFLGMFAQPEDEQKTIAWCTQLVRHGRLLIEEEGSTLEETQTTSQTGQRSLAPLGETNHTNNA